jgi:hypothetical protein
MPPWLQNFGLPPVAEINDLLWNTMPILLFISVHFISVPVELLPDGFLSLQVYIQGVVASLWTPIFPDEENSMLLLYVACSVTAYAMA